MSAPTPWVRTHNFSQELGNQHGINLDEEFDDGRLTVREILQNLALIQRDDTKLANGSVHPDALDTATLALIASEFIPRGEWVTGTAYFIGDIVEVGITGSYVAVTDHVAGAVFATDKAAGKWISLSGLTATQAASTVVSFFQSVITGTSSLRGTAGIANGQVANVSGYYASGDHGGGLFYWDSSSVAVDNDGTVIQPTATVGAGRWLMLGTERGVFVEQFGAKGDDSTDDHDALQAAIDEGTNNIKVLLRAGRTYRNTAPLISAKRSGGNYSLFSFEMEAVNYSGASSIDAEAAIINCTYNDTFGLGIHCARKIRIKNIRFDGVNNPPITGNFSAIFGDGASFVTGGCRDSRYSPYAGVVVDPFFTSVPPDGGYPGLASFYSGTQDFSDFIEIENVTCKGFTAGAIIAPNGGSANAESLAFRTFKAHECKVGLATCTAGTKNLELTNFACTNVYTAVDTYSYGAQSGASPVISGGLISRCKYLFKLSIDTSVPFEADGLFCENFLSLGYIGSVGSNSNGPSLFGGCFFEFDWVAGHEDIDAQLVSFGPVLFNACYLGFRTGASANNLLRFWADSVGNAQPAYSFNTCCFAGTNDQRDFMQYFAAANFLNSELQSFKFINCRANSTNATAQKLIDSNMNLRTLADINSLPIVPGALLKNNSSSLTLYQTLNAINAHALGALTVTLVGDGTATFVPADVNVFRGGDLVFDHNGWAGYNIDETLSMVEHTAIGYVTNIGGGTVTVSGVPENYPGGSRTLSIAWMGKFHTAGTGDTHTNTTVDNVSNITAWTVGDRIKGAGIPSGAYVTVVNVGGNTLTISKAATATAAGVRLYDADVAVFTGAAL